MTNKRTNVFLIFTQVKIQQLSAAIIIWRRFCYWLQLKREHQNWIGRQDGWHNCDSGSRSPLRTPSLLWQNIAWGGHWVLFWYVSSEEFYNICKLTAIFCSQKNSSIRHHNRRDVTHYHHHHVVQCFASNCNLFSETGKALATSWTCTGAKFYWPIKVSLVNVDNYVHRCTNQSQCHRCQCQ